jgi:tetratricopeptide (TPR) repeat protein
MHALAHVGLVAVLAVAAVRGDAFASVAAPQEAEAAPSAPDTAAQVASDDPLALFDAGVAAWREGRHARAGELWLATLERLGPPDRAPVGGEPIVDRHVLLANLGNAAFRSGDPARAVGWFGAALAYAPRDAATLANLALARERAELPEPARRGWRGALEALAARVTDGEARLLALLGLVPLALALLFEALRSGRRGVVGVVVTACVAGAALFPLAARHFVRQEAPHLVLRSGVDLLAEAQEGATAVGALAPGAVVEVVDELPRWLAVARDGAPPAWAPRDALFALER